MGTGDVTVLGMVADTHLIEDLGIWVQKGVAVTIPGHLTLVSKDLHRAISQRHLALIHNPSTLPALRASAGLAKEEREKLESEIHTLTAQVSALQDRNAYLEATVTGLQAELRAQKDSAQKLDAILQAIQERPLVTQVIQTSAGAKVAAPEVVSGEAPMFIPSQIRPDNVEERVAVQEEQSESSVTSAADKLKQMRKGKAQ